MIAKKYQNAKPPINQQTQHWHQLPPTTSVKLATLEMEISINMILWREIRVLDLVFDRIWIAYEENHSTQTTHNKEKILPSKFAHDSNKFGMSN